jgi:hypothetical protein
MQPWKQMTQHKPSKQNKCHGLSGAFNLMQEVTFGTLVHTLLLQDQRLFHSP